jgi:hypothetical protein
VLVTGMTTEGSLHLKQLMMSVTQGFRSRGAGA